MRRLILALVLILVPADAALAQRVALVVGVGAYRNVPPLTNTLNDAQDLAAALQRLGFRTDLVQDPDRPPLLILDACRDNPFRLRLATGSRSAAVGAGLGQVHAAVGTLVAFSTAPGTVAADGAGRNSPFTTALLRRIETPGIELRQMLAEVRRDVREATGGRQVPWEHSALEGTFYFTGGPAPGAAGTELVFWESVRNSADRHDLEAYLARFPQGAFVELARNRLRSLGTPGAPAAVSSDVALTEASLAAALGLHLPAGDAQRIAAAYVAERGPFKAIAINPLRRRSFRLTGQTEGNDVAEMTLERCHIFYGSPCQLVGVDDRLTPGRRAETMPRLAYAGAFDPAQVPGQPSSRRAPDSDLARYTGGRDHKAMAIHGTGRLYWRTGAASAEEAQEAALRACTEANERANREGPCMLYAVGNRVVLAERRRSVAR